MQIITTIQEIRDIAVKAKHKGSVGYVPTMGALHEGHGSLIKKAREENDTVIVSVFVNPLQFRPGEDYEAYPRDIEKDGKFCENLGVDYIFHPSSEEMYPKNFGFRVVPPDNMTHILCGITRPIHFTGVATVLAKFFTVIRPTKAYFGQKDVQQVAIVKAMVEDLNLNLDIVPCPIVRENDGLAKSSRNTYLTTDERQAATVLSRALKLALNEAKNGNLDAENIKQKVVDEIQKEPLAKIDYVEILRFSNFERVKTIEKDTFMAMAVYIGNTRLIDNTFFDELNTL